MRQAPDVIPITEFRKDAARIIADATTSRTPVFVTQNGYVTAVLLSPDEYSSLLGMSVASDAAAGGSAATLARRRSPGLVETRYGLTDPETAALVAEEGSGHERERDADEAVGGGEVERLAMTYGEWESGLGARLAGPDEKPSG